jgi:hypothetical protein
VDAYIAAFAAERDEDGRRLVVRDGYHQGGEVLTSAGAVQVTAPGGPAKTPSRKPPKDLDPQVLTIAPTVTRSTV